VGLDYAGQREDLFALQEKEWLAAAEYAQGTKMSAKHIVENVGYVMTGIFYPESALTGEKELIEEQHRLNQRIQCIVEDPLELDLDDTHNDPYGEFVFVGKTKREKEEEENFYNIYPS
jgi:hypothetical protein